MSFTLDRPQCITIKMASLLMNRLIIGRRKKVWEKRNCVSPKSSLSVSNLIEKCCIEKWRKRLFSKEISRLEPVVRTRIYEQFCLPPPLSPNECASFGPDNDSACYYSGAPPTCLSLVLICH